MPPTMSAAAASCRLYAPPWPLTCSVLYVIPYVVLLVLNRHWTFRGIEQPAAFCVGTTAEYRNGFGSDYSALTPSITLRPLHLCTRRCAPGLARRLRRVPRLRHLRRHQLGHRPGGC